MDAYILNWFEIPVVDFDRARKFYETLLDEEMQTETLNGFRMAYFPFYGGRPTGCIIEDENMRPSADHGARLYLNGDPDLSVMLNRAEQAGGEILEPKQPVSPEYGFYAVFLDSEGNKVGLHSAK